MKEKYHVGIYVLSTLTILVVDNELRECKNIRNVMQIIYYKIMCLNYKQKKYNRVLSLNSLLVCSTLLQF
jgi:hypothetical protein